MKRRSSSSTSASSSGDGGNERKDGVTTMGVGDGRRDGRAISSGRPILGASSFRPTTTTTSTRGRAATDCRRAAAPRPPSRACVAGVDVGCPSNRSSTVVAPLARGTRPARPRHELIILSSARQTKDGWTQRRNNRDCPGARRTDKGPRPGARRDCRSLRQPSADGLRCRRYRRCLCDLLTRCRVARRIGSDSPDPASVYLY